MGRAALAGLRHPLNGIALFKGYMSNVAKQYDDLREFVPNLQKRMLVKRIREILGM